MKRLAWLGVLALVLGLGWVWWAGGALFAPVRERVGALPSDLPGRAMEVRSPAGGTLKGWLVPGRRGWGVVLLMHGIRANRTSMLERARFLHAAGYGVVLYDSRAHGESGGDRITFGYLESRDARAVLGFLRTVLPGERVGVIGVSLGGAACLIGPQPLGVNALVVEAVYPTLAEAIENRLRIRFGVFGAMLSPLLSLELRHRLGFSADDLRPIDNVGRLGAPIFIIAGAEDRHTRADQVRRLFDEASGPKDLWIVAGAAHVDLHRFARVEYERRTLAFLSRYLGSRLALRPIRSSGLDHPR